MSGRMNDKELLDYINKEIDYDSLHGKLYWRNNKNNVKAGDECGKLSQKGRLRGGPYRCVRIKKHTYTTHRLIYLIENGHSPKGIIDHDNRNTIDNRIGNLKDVTHSVNNKNQKLRSTNSSGCLGVTFKQLSQKWEARIGHEGKRIHLGIFDNKSDAIKCRKKAEVKYGYHKNHGT